MQGVIVDITGNRYGRLFVIGFDHATHGRSYWICRCDCGRIVILRKDHFAYSYSHQKSCGCLHRELSSARMLERHRRRRELMKGVE